MTIVGNRISDELYEEMDLWYGAIVEAFCDAFDFDLPDLSEEETFLEMWKHDIGDGMGVACITPNCEYHHSEIKRETK